MRPEYKWTALIKTTIGMLMASINHTIRLLSLPAVFVRGSQRAALPALGLEERQGSGWRVLSALGFRLAIELEKLPEAASTKCRGHRGLSLA